MPRKSERSQEEDRPLLKIIEGRELGRKKIADVKFSDVDALHRKLTKQRGPYRANRVPRWFFGKMFALSIRWGWRTDNPAPERRAQPRA